MNVRRRRRRRKSHPPHEVPHDTASRDASREERSTQSKGSRLGPHYTAGPVFKLGGFVDPDPGSRLRLGSTGEDVHKVQMLLNQHGFRLDTDGIFGPLTREAVVAFQREHGILADGTIGPNTWQALTMVSTVDNKTPADNRTPRRP